MVLAEEAIEVTTGKEAIRTNLEGTIIEAATVVVVETIEETEMQIEISQDTMRVVVDNRTQRRKLNPKLTGGTNSQQLLHLRRNHHLKFPKILPLLRRNLVIKLIDKRKENQSKR